jgi:acetoacetate decarboxylase
MPGHAAALPWWASLVPSPPWHYVGDLMVIEYWADPPAVRAGTPGPDPHPTGSCTTGGDHRAAADPARSQYMSSSSWSTRCWAARGGHNPLRYIRVDRDFALMRAGSRASRSPDRSDDATSACRRAEPGLRPGAGGTCAANDRRLAQGDRSLENITDSGPTHNAAQLEQSTS